MPSPIEKRPPWIVRHWLLGIISIFVLIMLAIAASCFAFFSGVESSMRKSGAYQQAMEQVRHSTPLADALGSPIKEGWFVTGEISESGGGDIGSANFAIPVSGPRGKGTVNVEAKKFGGRWELRRLEVQVEGNPEPIRLLEAPEIRLQ